MKPLIQALARASLKFQGLSKDGTGHTGREGARAYQYMTLDNILAVVRPALAEEGLFLWHDPRITGNLLQVFCNVSDGEFTLTNCVTLPVSFPEKANQAQAMGSLITYGKRYSASALLGIGASEDDDAKSTHEPEKPSGAIAPRIIPAGKPEPEIVHDEEPPVSDPVLKGKLDWLRVMWKRMPVVSDEDRERIVAEAYAGKTVPELKDLIEACSCTTEGRRA